MARRKVPTSETSEQKRIRQIKDLISGLSDRSEKVSFNRKMDNMVKLMTKLEPIENQILELNAKKIPIFDEIQQLRNLMVEQCVHPFEYIVVNQDHAVCKFCNRKISLPRLEHDDK